MNRSGVASLCLSQTRHFRLLFRKYTATRKQDKAKRREVLMRLREVGRVHAPEADMRPVLPHRELLLQSVAHGDRSMQWQKRNPAERFHVNRPASCAFVERLKSKAVSHALAGKMDCFEDIAREAATPPTGIDPKASLRAVTISVIQRIAPHDSEKTSAVMNSLADTRILQSLPNDDIGTLLDVLVRNMLYGGNVSNAFRGELLSRLLETKLRRGTYTALIAKTESLELGLAVLHRAIAVGIKPNRKMLHAVLELCFSADDGSRAKAVMAEMAARGITVNGDTIRLLLSQARCFDTITAVFQLVQASNSVSKSPALSKLFVEAYLTVPAFNQEEIDGNIAKAFEIVDWFFDGRIGVPHDTINAILEYCVRTEHTEGALRAWREMRRGWLGPPSRRTRKMLWNLLAGRSHLKGRLFDDALDQKDLGKLHRMTLTYVNDIDVDIAVLEGTEVKDQAAVLHRWSRTGRAKEAMRWIENRIAETSGGGVDSRLVLSVLSDDDDRTRSKSLDFCLAHLASGTNVYGNQVDVLRRAVDGIWKWILRAGIRDEHGNVPFYDSVDRTELHSCLQRVVRVKPEPIEAV